jgi:hypothetical protein
MMQTKTVYTKGAPHILIKKCEENKNPGKPGFIIKNYLITFSGLQPWSYRYLQGWLLHGYRTLP